jgi:AraC-like DNA-binding protein
MNGRDNILDTIILLGTLQGFVVTALLFFSKGKTQSNRMLGGIMMLMSMACLNIYLLETGFQSHTFFWSVVEAVVPLIIIMPVGPLIFFYVNTFVNPDFRLTRKQAIHFYPAVLDVVTQVVAALYIIGLLLKVGNHWTQPEVANFIDSYNMYVDIPRWISVSVYTGLAYRLLRRHGKQARSAGKSLSWPAQFVYGFVVFQVIWLLHLVPYIIPATSNILLDTVSWYPIYVPLAVLVYWLGIKGFFLHRDQRSSSPKTLAVEKDVIDHTLRALTKAMEEDRIFLDPTLNLDKVVAHTGISQKNISAVLNQYLGKSFNEYINEFRVGEVKQRLTDPRYAHLTLTGIAFECGFNSQATFQRIFKQSTNQSPREFRHANLNK